MYDGYPNYPGLYSFHEGLFGSTWKCAGEQGSGGLITHSVDTTMDLP